MLIQMVMSFCGYPVSMNSFVMHHQKERFVLAFPSVEPFFRVFSNQIRHIPQMTCGIIFSNKMRITIFSLIIQNHPMIETCRLRNKMPLTNNSCLVTICLQYLRKGLLRTVKTFRPVLHETIFMAMFTRKYGSTARPGNRIATIVILENRSFMPDTVNIRSRCHFPYRMTINTHSLTGMVITHNKNDIGAFVTDFLFLTLYNGGRHKR